jgi:hypothetical protein
MQRFPSCTSHTENKCFMKKILTYFCCLIFIFSCTRETATVNNVADNGCISIAVAQASQTSLSASQIQSIDSLFQANNMSTDGLQFIEYIPDIYSDTTKPPHEQVAANLFLNGLPVFHYTEAFDFNNGVFDTSALYTGAPANNNADGHQSLTSLRTDFLDHVSESKIEGGVLNATPFTPSASTYVDTCLAATLGYVDATAVPGNTLPYGNLVKVWSITPSHGTYPCVYVEDDNGLAWGVPLFLP